MTPARGAADRASDPYAPYDPDAFPDPGFGHGGLSERPVWPGRADRMSVRPSAVKSARPFGIARDWHRLPLATTITIGVIGGSRWSAHMNTVAGNEMLVLDAAKRYPNTSFFGLNPGFIKTNIRSNLFGGDTLLYRLIEWMTGLLAPSAGTYAERLTPLLLSPDFEGRSGAMCDQDIETALFFRCIFRIVEQVKDKLDRCMANRIIISELGGTDTTCFGVIDGRLYRDKGPPGPNRVFSIPRRWWPARMPIDAPGDPRA